MKKKIKIGIPRTYLYYRNYILWKTFFEKLNCHIILSSETTEETLEKGKKYIKPNLNLSTQIYMGHIASLIEKCDYLLIPILKNSNEQELKQYNELYNIALNLFPEQQIITNNIKNNKITNEFIEFLKIGLKIKKNILKIIISYIKAKKCQQKQEKIENVTQERKLNNSKTKILLVGYPYNIYDKYLSSNIIEYLNSNNIQIIYPDKLSKKTSIEYSQEISKTTKYTYSKELIGSISYYKEIYEGIIFLSTNSYHNNIINELILSKINKPYLNIILDEKISKKTNENQIEKFINNIEENNK